MLPDLNRLKIFYHVYSRQSINLAAKDLFLTQPGISQHIQKLESEIGTPLFIRLHKKIVPTLAGEQLYTKVKPFIESLTSEIQTISAPNDRPFGKLRMGAPLEFGKTYLPRICNGFRQQYPQVNFVIRLEEPDQLLSMINKGELDFALIDYFSAKDQFLGRPELYTIEPLVKETFVLACSKAYFEDRMNHDLSFEKLVSMEFITDENDPAILRHWFWYYFKRSLPDINFAMSINSHQAALSCIRLGMGLGVTSMHLILPEIRQKKLVPLFPDQKKVVNHISLVQLRAKKPTLTDETFQKHLKQQMKETAHGWGDDENIVEFPD